MNLKKKEEKLINEVIRIVNQKNQLYSSGYLEYTFSEIAHLLGLGEDKTKAIYEQAMKKLSYKESAALMIFRNIQNDL